MNATVYCFLNAMESEASAIARGLRRRDPDLLHRLIEQYQHRLLCYLVYLSGNRELAKDLLQETWMRVIERAHQVRPPARILHVALRSGEKSDHRLVAQEKPGQFLAM